MQGCMAWSRDVESSNKVFGAEAESLVMCSLL